MDLIGDLIELDRLLVAMLYDTSGAVSQGGHLLHLLINLLGNLSLFPYRLIDLADDRRQIIKVGKQVAHGPFRLLNLSDCLRRCLRTGLHSLHGLGGIVLQSQYHLLYLFDRPLASTGQQPHFVCHHRKAPSLFTGTRGFNRRIQRQQIGLL